MYESQYFFETTSFFKHNIRIEILRLDFVGVSQRIIKAEEQPVTIQWESTNRVDPYFPIWGSSLEFSFIEQAGIGLKEIATDYERDAKVNYFVDNRLHWTGWIVPDLCNDFADRDNTVIKIVAMDAIGAIADFPFLVSQSEIGLINDVSDFGAYDYVKESVLSRYRSNEIVNTVTSILQIIKACLDKTGLALNIEITNDLFPVDLVTEDERVFERVLVDYMSYQNDGTSKSCEEVLTSILRTFGANVKQKNGAWSIERVNYLEGLEVSVELYDKDAKFVKIIPKNVGKSLKYKGIKTHKDWRFNADNFMREFRPPYQFQNITINYGENLTITSYKKTPWINKGVARVNSVINSSGDIQVTVKDDKYNLVGDIIRIVNPLSISEKDKLNFKNKLFRDGFFTGLESSINYNNEELELSFFTNSRICVFFIFIEEVQTATRTVRYHYYRKDGKYQWISGDFINAIANQVPSPDNGFTLIDTEFRTVQSDFSEDTSIKQEFEVKIPINPPVRYGSFTDVSLKIIARGGTSLAKKEDPTTIYYRDLKITSKQTKEVHAFTNLKRVTNKSDDIEVYNGDGFGDGFTRSNFQITKETTEFPYTSKPFSTKVWKDSTIQDADNILSFAARSILNNFQTRKNVIRGVLGSKQIINIGDVLKFESFKKFNYQRLLVIPPLRYSARNDEYEVTLFELSCDIATGRLKEYYLDSSDTPLSRRIEDYTGVICYPTFEAESICIIPSFDAISICQ